jgi:hypothetical protein
MIAVGIDSYINSELLSYLSTFKLIDSEIRELWHACLYLKKVGRFLYTLLCSRSQYVSTIMTVHYHQIKYVT